MMGLRFDAGAAGSSSCVQLKIHNWKDPRCKQSEFKGRLQAPRRSPPASGWRTPATPSSPISWASLDRWHAARRKGLSAEDAAHAVGVLRTTLFRKDRRRQRRVWEAWSIQAPNPKPQNSAQRDCSQAFHALRASENAKQPDAPKDQENRRWKPTRSNPIKRSKTQRIGPRNVA